MGGEVATTLGATLRATFEQPMAGGLLAQQFELAGARSEGFTREQRVRGAQEEMARTQEIDRLRSEILHLTDPADREKSLERIEELSKGREETLDRLTRESIEAGRMQEPEVLAEKYGDLGLTFDRPMATAEAQLLAQGKREEIIRNAIIQSGPKGVAPTVARFGAGLAATAVDPVELASMFIPVVSPARRAYLTAKLGKVGGRAVTGAIEGLVGSAITEPFYYGLSQAQQLDYTMSDALLNVGLGAVLGGGLGAGVGALSRADVDAPRMDVELRVEEDNALALFDAALSRAKIEKARRVSSDVALRQFSTGQSVSAFDIYRSISAQDEIAALYKSLDQSRKWPITSFIKDNYKIDPDGAFGRELKSMGVTPQTAPGLFSRSGLDDLDNIVARDADQIVPGISRVVGDDRTYLDRQGLLDAISNEISGEDVMGLRADVIKEAEFLENYDARIEGIARQADALGFSVRSEEELRLLSDLVYEGRSLDEAFERLAIASESDAIEGLARQAQDIDADPLANVEASRRLETDLGDMFPDTLDDLEAMVAELDKAGALDADMKTDLDAVKEIEIKSRSYRAATEAASACLVGG